ncbi:hypothetical protein VN97_g10311 [Penicillium thymicola]|uniref:Uncharacterized protein n=1 Tax=Penicillium thymicola TaxID=293382 RepID=A0AAI9TAQ7_PENTH|nr:hypothetical protein VN97_g10311 [Penicillium thymicola]
MFHRSVFLRISSLEPQDRDLFDDFILFDSILPNIFPSTPFFDIEPQDTLTAGKAVQLLECALQRSPVLSLLEPILILFTLDASHSHRSYRWLNFNT